MARYFGPRLASLVHEQLWIAALDTHGRVRETRLLARGSDDALYVGRATVLRTALDMAAHSFLPRDLMLVAAPRLHPADHRTC
ncbi:uncharacterized protein SOCE26_084080 [Sorangium cellulosum]|uniref:RadC-like JAB domain-containing protein n=1 Tax=Sorangium cellulosum TaxID=56 RepID=A0A2L0F5N1_SORCE|nr:uncharacterized protein SOCE26_084080 [Sorangium cellulosum]